MNGRYFSEKFQIGLVVAIAVVVFANSVFGDFVWHDKSFITDQTEISYGVGAFANQLVGKGVLEQEGEYRPVAGVIYFLSYSLWGGRPFGYHVQAIAVHALGSVLVYLIASKVQKRKHVALVAGMLFAAHPIHVEAVSWITASVDLVGVVMVMASFWLYLVSLKNKRRVLYWSSVLLAGLGGFANEITLVLPVLIIGHDWIIGGFDLKRLVGEKARYIPYILILIFYAYVRFWLLAIGLEQSYMFGSLILTGGVMVVAVATYLKLLVMPLGMSAGRTFFPKITTFFYQEYGEGLVSAPELFGVNVVASVVVVAAIAYSVVYFKKQSPLVSFGAFWFLVSLLPVLQILPQDVIFSERYAYLASVGFVILLAWALERYIVTEKLWKNSTRGFLAVGVVITGLYGLISVSQNKVWESDVSLWSNTLKLTPDSAYVLFNLGMAYLDSGDLEKAGPLFEQMLTINPDNQFARDGLGEIGKLE